MFWCILITLWLWLHLLKTTSHSGVVRLGRDMSNSHWIEETPALRLESSSSYSSMVQLCQCFYLTSSCSSTLKCQYHHSKCFQTKIFFARHVRPGIWSIVALSYGPVGPENFLSVFSLKIVTFLIKIGTIYKHSYSPVIIEFRIMT